MVYAEFIKPNYAIDDKKLINGDELVLVEPHQLLSVSKDENNILTVHFTMFSPHYQNNVDEAKFAVFQEKLAAFDLESSESQKETVIAFGDMMNDINPDYRNGFKKGIGHPAITADIKLEPNRPLIADYRLTMGVMTEQLTPEEAEKHAIHHKKENFTALKKVMQNRSPARKMMGFKEISSEITGFLHKDTFEFNLMNNVGAIYNTNRRDNSKKLHNKEEIIYGSTLNYSKDFKKHGEKINKAVVRITANRKAEQSINLLSLSQYLADGTAKFSNEFFEAVSQYKMMTRNFDILIAPWYKAGMYI